MKYLAILVISVISLVQADGGHYVPKSVYFIDENGNPSDAHPINSGLLNRVRRQVPPGFGNFPFPQPVFNYPQIQPGQGGQSSFIQSSIASRFGEDEPVVTGQTQTFHSSGGKYQSTSTVLRPDGSTQTNKQSGRTRRQTQIQSQAHEDGKTQLQTQSNEAPGGVQFQSQSQPGMAQTQSQGDGPLPQQPHGAPTDRAQNIDNRPPPQQQPNYPQEQHQNPQGHQANYPQGQQPPPHQQQPNYPQGQQHVPQQQPNYPQGQPGFPGAFPFGFGGFAPGFGFPQQGFGFPQPGFGFAPGFGGPIPQQPQPAFIGGTQSLDNRFGEDEVPTVVGGTQTITSQNGVYHATSSILKPDGQVETTHHSGKFPSKKN